MTFSSDFRVGWIGCLSGVTSILTGLALVGSMDSHDALQAGRLVRLLPEWSFGTLDIWAVTPQRDAQPAKVRQAIAALHAYLKQVPGISD